MRRRQFADEAGGDGTGPLAVDAAIGRVEDIDAPPSARDRDIGETALLLQRRIAAFIKRALHEITRVPGAALPGVLAPSIFLVGLSGVFGEAARLPGFDATDFRTFIVPVGLLQGAAFTGAATGVNLARDIERLPLQPVVDRVFPFGAAPEAYRHLRSGAHVGKVVIRC